MTAPLDARPVIRVSAPTARSAERRYVLDQVLGEWFGLRYELEPGRDGVVTLSRLDAADGRCITIPDVLFATPTGDWCTERCLPQRPLHRVEVPEGTANGPGDRRPASSLPVLFGDQSGGGFAWRETTHGLALEVDLLGGIFAMLSRLEETVPGPRDRHGRFPIGASLAHAEGFVDRPLADDYADVLWLALRSVWPDLRRVPQTFRLHLTHDIDRPWSALGRPPAAAVRAAGGDIAKRRDAVLALRRLRAIADARRGRVDRDPLNTFDLLMETSERHGLRSTFYFQAGTTPDDPDFRYRLTDPPFAGVLRRIHERGHEIGLHESYGSDDSAAQVVREAEGLREACRRAGVEQEAWGGRQHYLRFRNPDSWRHHEAAGLVHDSTLGYAERPGFRSGTCREHGVFDVIAGRPLRLRERPLIVMDASMFGYMALGYEEAAEVARRMVATCRAYGGTAVLLYHNDALASDRAKTHYRELVADLAGLR